ncbi:hypothetical protein ACFVIM_19315 [Streptomyces sp. NPDC057638]|uniref:hypothetical protein n=1 Tax=Streptomyces sp. NPDC057638 TaxID=3346190 RepID=UPI0036CC4483
MDVYSLAAAHRAELHRQADAHRLARAALAARNGEVHPSQDANPRPRKRRDPSWRTSPA